MISLHRVVLAFCGVVGAGGAIACGGGTAASASAREAPPSGAAAGAMGEEPGVYEVLHEDERVRVVEMRLPPGQSDDMHRHPHTVAYFIGGAGARVDVRDGDSRELELGAGEVLSHPPRVHSVTNTGEELIHGIMVELKTEPGQGSMPLPGTDAVSVNSGVYTLVHEDERARVLRMQLNAGERDGQHTHPDEVTYFMTGGKVVITAESREDELEIPDAHVWSREGWSHTIDNVGMTDIEAVIWELK